MTFAARKLRPLSFCIRSGTRTHSILLSARTHTHTPGDHFVFDSSRWTVTQRLKLQHFYWNFFSSSSHFKTILQTLIELYLKASKRTTRRSKREKCGSYANALCICSVDSMICRWASVICVCAVCERDGKAVHTCLPFELCHILEKSDVGAQPRGKKRTRIECDGRREAH